MDYCDISYAAHGSGSLYIYKSNPTIKNSTIKYSSQAGIYIVQYGSPLIENCIIQNNETYGIRTDNGSPKIINNSFSGNKNYDVYYNSSSGGSITENTFNNGLYIQSGTVSQLDSNTFNYNDSYPVGVSAANVGELVLSSTFSNLSEQSSIQVASGTVAKDSVWTNAIKYKITGDIYVRGTDGDDAVTTLTIEPGTVLKFNSGRHLEIGDSSSSGSPGALRAIGTPDKRITFTSSATTPTPGSWNGIYFYTTTHDATTIMEYCDISYGSQSSGGSLYLVKASPTIKNSNISYSTGSGIFCSYNTDSAPTIDSNTFSNINSYDLYYSWAADGSVIGNTFNHGIYSTSGTFDRLSGNTFNYNNDYSVRIHPNNVSNLVSENTFNNLDDESVLLVNGGTISRDSVWTDAITYKIIDNVYVKGTNGDDGVTTLSIEPGTVLKFNSGRHLEIGDSSSSGSPGALRAIGTPDKRITFTSSATTPTPGSWNGIYFYTTTHDATTIMEYCDISYGSQSSGGSLYLVKASPTIKNSNISYSTGSGIFCSYNTDSAPTIDSNTFSNINSYDLYYSWAADGSVIGNTFNHGIYSTSGTFDRLSGNTFNYNNDYSVRIHPNNVSELSLENTFNNLDDNSVVLVNGGTLSKDSTWSNDIAYNILGTITVSGTDGQDNLTTLIINPGVQLKFNSNYQLNIGNSSGNPGALIAQGNKDNRIKFTSANASPSTGDWRGVYINNTASNSRTLMEYCTIEYAGSSYGGLYIYQASPTIQYNIFENNSNAGVYVSGSGSNSAVIGCNSIQNNKYGVHVAGSAYPQISNNNFNGNSSFALYSTNSGELDATSNWWNDENGPGFNGEEISGNINAFPQLTVPSTCINNDPTNMPPFAPYDPTPVDNAVNVVITDQAVTASWQGQDPNYSDTLVYDIYLGTAEDALELKAENIGAALFQFTDLLPGNTYFWQVIARDSAGEETAGPVWQFTTAGNPPDLIINSLTWSPDTNLAADQEVSISVEVLNNGTGPSIDAFQVSLTIDGTLTQTWAIDEILLAGQNKTFTHTWTALTGDHTIEAMADSGQTILESVEDNNILAKTITGISDPAPPVLVSTVPEDGTYLQQINSISFTLADTHGQVDDAAVISSVQVLNDDGQSVLGSVAEADDTFTFTPATVPMASSGYTVSLTAADAWGNTADYSFTFTADSIAPLEPTITGGTVDSGIIQVTPFANWSSNHQITLTGTRDDDTRVTVLAETDPLINITGAIRHVGSSAEYTTIQAAIDAASDGDVILIDPGTYLENVDLNKWVHIKGNTANPEDILIKSPGNAYDGYPETFMVSIDYNDPVGIPLVVEGISIEPFTYSWNNGLAIRLTSNAGDGEIIFNRCRFQEKSSTYPIGRMTDSEVFIRFINCYMERGYSHFRGMETSNWSLEKCQLDGSYFCYDCSGTPAPSDYVTSDTEDYGTSYGTWYLGYRMAASTDIGSGDWSMDLTLAQGQNSISVHLEDRAGNIGPAVWVDMFVDSIAPEIQAINPEDQAHTNTIPSTVDISYLEQTSGLDTANSVLSIKDEKLTELVGNWTDSGAVSGVGTLSFTPSAELEEGTYQIEVRLQDNFGNQGTAKLSYFTIDTTAPDTPVIDAVTSPTFSLTQDITGTKEAYAALILDGVKIGDHTAQTTWSHTVTLTSGQNTFEFALEDRAGNISETASADIYFDDTPPQAVDTLTLDPQGNGTTVTLDWTGFDESLHGDVTGYRIYAEPAVFTSVTGLSAVNTIDAGTFTTTVTGLDRNTPYWFAVIAVDTAGNAMDEATPATTTPVDVIAPENPASLTVQPFETSIILGFTPSQNSHNDLAGHRLYLDDSTTPTSIPVDATQYEQTNLTSATAYTFKLTAVDADGNESAGTAIQGITLLDNPGNLTATPYSGYVNLSWQASVPAEYVDHYKVYKSESTFTDVSAMTPVKTTTNQSVNLTGLTNNTTYYFAVTAVNLSGGEQTIATAVSATPTNDTQGPSLSAIRFDDAALVDNMTLEDSGFVSVDMTDPSGMGYVEFYFNGELVRRDYSAPYSAYIDIYNLSDGSYTLSVTGTDSLGNTNTHTYTLVVGLTAPAAPAITSPADNSLTNKEAAVISGTCDKYTDITLYLNGVAVDPSTSIGALGMFDLPVTLIEGENRIKATASNRSGTSPESAEILINLDTSIPDAPRSLAGQSKPDGEITLVWQRPLNKLVEGFDIYRSGTDFTTKDQAEKVNTSLITTTAFTDLPTSEGTWVYRALAVDASGNESALSDAVSVDSDSTAPSAQSIVYTSRGITDPDSGRFAPATVDVICTVSEALAARPFLTITPTGGIPISVELEQESDLVYEGSFTIAETTPSGTAYAVFSARDIAGNRGTDITSGSQILLDTQGPAVTRLDITPVSPVKNSVDAPVEMMFSLGLTEGVKDGETPSISLELSGTGDILDASDITLATAQTGEVQSWQTRITLPQDAGLTEAQTATVLFSARDDLDNIGTTISVDNQFQVYQGGLPPLEPPTSLSAKALAGGVVTLAWDAVEGAAGYQIYCKAPGEADLYLIDTIDALETYTHQTALDGIHTYAIATIRQENQEESVSGLSATATADSDATVPNPPLNLALELTSQGIKISWDAPVYTESVTYNIYRSDQIEITSVEGMTPLVTDIGQTMVIDPTPSPTDHCYAVTAVDSTGNESLPSTSQYLNFDLLPVSTISVSQTDTDSPVLTWSHADTTGKIQGYYLYLGTDRTGFQVNQVPMASETYTDYGYTFENRSYYIIAVDTNDVQSMGRYITLPRMSLTLNDDTDIKRGIMNAVTFTVDNLSGEALSGMVLKAQLGGRTHESDTFSMDADESKTVEVIIGGYEDLSDIELLTATLVITPNTGETVSITRTSQVEVSESLMPLQIKNEEFIRGGIGKVWFTLSNTGAAEAEIATAESSNQKSSADIRYYLMDEDDNVLYSQSFKQSLGDHIITLSNKRTVARIPAGEVFISEPMDLFVPANAPDTVYVRLEIDHIYNSLGQTGQVTMAGTRTRQEISLQDTSYYGEILSTLPEVSKGDQDIVITGQAVDRSTDEPLADVPLNLFITVDGFERKVQVATGDDGTFTHTFEPLENEAGIFYVHAVHPDLLDRPDQGSFIINRVQVTPSKIQIGIPRNYEQKITLNVVTEEGTGLTNLTVAPVEDLPQGVHLDCGNPITIVEGGRTISLAMTLWADNTAEDASQIELTVTSDESTDAPWATILLDALYSESEPVLYFTPDHIETGVAQDDMVTESITLSNKGLADMAGITLTLVDSMGNAAPDWVRLNTTANIGTLAVGEKRDVSISFLPGTDEPQGMQIFYLNVTSDNYPETKIGLYPTISSSGIGNVLFKLSDIYTGTFNEKNELIRGLSGAKIWMQNEATLSDHYATTDELGEAMFEDLSSGAYKCRITADNHQETTTRVWVKPGITTAEEVFLEYNLVTVEWEVNEITIEDKYEILLSATFETDVPAAVVVIEPLSVTLPDMEKGDVYLGEFTLTNHGLIRADDLEIPIPESDDNFQYEILTGIPDSLEAKQIITIPYRITCLKSLDTDDEEDQTGGGCYTYRKCIPVSYAWECANGELTKSAIYHCFYKSGGTCSTGSSSGGSSSSGGGGSYYYGGGSGSTSSPAPAYTPMETDEQKCLPKPEQKECKTGNCKNSGMNQSTTIGSEINTLMREYRDDATDLFVKTPGGIISVTRRYWAGSWQWDEHVRVTDGRVDDTSSGTTTNSVSITEYGPDYVSRGVVPYEKTASGVYKSDTYTIERQLGIAAAYTQDMYTFKDKHGNWIKYDNLGRPTSYGTRTGTTGTYIYDSQDDAPPTGIEDRNGNQVFWFEYDGSNNLTRAYDADARQVLYEYTSGNLSKVTDVLGNETTYEYSNGNLVKKTNAKGHEVTITYNSSDDPIQVTNAAEGVHTFEYDYDKNKKEYYAMVKTPGGTIKEVWYSDEGETIRVDLNGDTIQQIDKDNRTYTITDRAGNETVKAYDENDNLKSVTYPDGTKVLYDYDLALNKVTQKQDRLNRITTFAYDDNGNLAQKVEAKGSEAERTTTYTNDDDGNLLTATIEADADTEASVTTFTYDDNGNLASVTDPEGHTTWFTQYDAMGNLLAKTDARGKEWSYVYDDKGRLKSTKDPLNQTTTFEYDVLDNRTAVIDANLNRTEYEYDTQSNLVKVIDPYLKETILTYTPDNKLYTQTDPSGNTVVYDYDNENRMTQTTDPAGNVTQVTYTGGSGCSSCTSGTGDQIDTVFYPTFSKQFTYDRLGRKLTETDVLSDTESRTTGFAYDDEGNLIQKTDAKGNDTYYTYDARNRLKLVADPAGGLTRYSYDARDNLISLTDAENQTTQFEYDKANRLLKEIRPMGQQTVYVYDENGNLAQKTDAKNQVTTYVYNAGNRLTQINYYADAADTTPAKTVYFTYDNAGNLLTWNDGSASGVFTYDDLNRKLTDTVNFGPFEKDIAYTWTDNSQKKSYKDPAGNVYNYTYANNQLAGIDLPGTGTITTSAYKWTRPKTIQYPGGAKQTRTYDSLMRLTSVTDTDVGDNQVMAYNYTHDNLDNITLKSTEHGDYEYDYDTLQRLKTVDNPETMSDEAFTYDAVGNRLTDTITSEIWVYNQNNELESYDNTSYEYDANGNMTKKTVNGVATLFFYNMEDRLERVEDESGTIIAQYSYDPFGRRLWKEASGIRTYFMYADEGLIGEYKTDGTETKTYGWQPGSTWSTDPLFMKQGSEYYFYHNDHLGTPQKMTSVNGAVVWSAQYNSFGKAEVDPASTVESNLRFPGQYFDAETDLHQNFWRYYNPDMGRYLKGDPIGLAGGINLYVYSLNDSINKIDPLGLYDSHAGHLTWFSNALSATNKPSSEPCSQKKKPANTTAPLESYSTFKYTAFCDYISAGEIIGGGVLMCWIDGPCKNGKKTVWATQTIVVGITAGSPGGRNYFYTGFEYNGSIKNINNGNIFEGFSHIIAAGYAAPSRGRSWAGIKLGSTLSRGSGEQTGYDLSADAFWGHTIVTDSWTEYCD